MNYIFLCIPFVVLPASYVLFRKFLKGETDLLMKIIALVLAAVFFVRYFASKGSLLNDVYRLAVNNPFENGFLCFMTNLLVWFSMASVVILTLLPFFKYDILKNYAKTFCLVVNILNLGFMPQIIYSFTSSYGLSLCGAFIAIEIGISLFLSVYTLVKNNFFKISKKSLLEMLCALPIVLVFSLLPYTLRVFFGNVGGFNVKGITFYHRIYIYLSFVVLFGIYFLLRKKEHEYIRMSLLYISLATLIAYCSQYDFSVFITPTRWPLHLCNTAMFILPICLIFKLDKIFYFTLFINVLGAFLALLMPNYDANLGFLSPTIVSFWINHIQAFVMPVLIILLGIYKRPNLRFFTYSMIGFLIYFVFILIMNAWLSNFDAGVDFFFLNSDFVADKLGDWAERTRNFVWSFNIGSLSFTFYPLYQFLFFLVYVVMGLGMWFLYTALFQIQDFYIDLGEKKKKIKLDEIALCVKYGEKEVENCMNKESKDKLVVKNLYKRYGNNKHYSVQDTSFEVESGEILGFLGPNGAGKSTIIKCIVGIQPMTSGTVEINGYDIEKQPVKAKEQFGFVPDHYALYEKLTGREYVNYMADLYGVSKEDRDKRLEKLVKDLNMEASFDNKIRTYSHGMKQKIAIMSALVHNPKLWILDEPLTGLDPNSIFEVKECMKEHAKAGNIVFFSSHIIDIVEKLCDRIIIIKKGKIQTTVTLKDLKKKKVSLEQFYMDIINAPDEEPEQEGESTLEPEQNSDQPKSKKKSKRAAKVGN